MFTPELKLLVEPNEPMAFELAPRAWEIALFRAAKGGVCANCERGGTTPGEHNIEGGRERGGGRIGGGGREREGEEKGRETEDI